MLVACRLAGLSALEAYYAGGRARAMAAVVRRNCGTPFRPLKATAWEVPPGNERRFPYRGQFLPTVALPSVAARPRQGR